MKTTRMKRWPDRLRRTALLLHRYVGLFLVVFLVVAGLTGSVLAFYRELDAALNPELFRTTGRSEPLDPFLVTERVQATMPKGLPFRAVRFDVEPGESSSAWVEAAPGEWHEWFIDPETGTSLGSRKWGDLSEGKKNLLPFLYRLHYSLALGNFGTLLFGTAALLWTLDCFVGAYLTFPRTERGGERPRRSFLRRWLPAWRLKTNKLFSFIFTWHRASGLWIWAFLFVIAWSGVGFNLRPVYRPVMEVLVGMKEEGHDTLPQLLPPFSEPKLSLREAHRRGREEIAREAKERGFTVEKELALDYADDHGVFIYAVKSSLDLSALHPRTEVYLDGQTGRFRGFHAPTGIAIGNTISAWLFHLHMGHVFGLWYRIALVFVGPLVALLSLSGAVIWWKKREKGRRNAKAGAEGAAPAQAPKKTSLGSRAALLPTLKKTGASER